MPHVKPKIVVVGSLNVDLIAGVPSLPSPGETIVAKRVVRHFGGKGANQAFAAARQGAHVQLIGAVGDDANGTAYHQHWRRHGLDGRGIVTVRGAATGTAFIAVQPDGENQIIVDPGAHARVTAASVRAQAAQFQNAHAVLLQGEIPVPAIVEAMRLARRAGAQIIFNPAPWPDAFPWGRYELDAVILNEQEAAQFFQHLPQGDERRAAAKRIIVTRGAKPTQVYEGGESTKIPTLKVQPLDTVGAGDAFAGTLAVQLAMGATTAYAIRAANVAGALATLKAGAQEACPTWAQVRRKL